MDKALEKINELEKTLTLLYDEKKEIKTKKEYNIEEMKNICKKKRKIKI